MNSPPIESSVAKLVLLAKEAGLSIDDLAQMLDSGFTTRELLEIIALRLTSPVHRTLDS
jgi:hypothetical protein